MSEDITPEVIGALAYVRQTINDPDTDDLLKGALLRLDQARVFGQIDAARNAAPAAGRHRRALGAGISSPVPPVPPHAPSFADTHPRAAHELGQLITNLTEPKPEAPAMVRFDVDLVYRCLQDNGDWTPPRTSQDTLYAEDQEKALLIASDRLLRKLRRAGNVSHADHLKVTSGVTRVSADA